MLNQITGMLLEYDIKTKTTMEFSSDMLHWEQDETARNVSEDERTNEQSFLQVFTKRILLSSLKAPKAIFSALMNDISQLISVSLNEFCEQVIVAFNKNGINTSNANE